MPKDAPTVSIITATYNRSNVLAYAIGSVVHGTFEDWELLIVGDACTDDSEEVVASFADERIRFRNLAENTGDQSGPNNHGFDMARGRYIAYLNHDDLWFPDHIEKTVHALDTTDADLVFSLGLVAGAQGKNRLTNAAPKGRYEPHFFVPASSWVMRREIIEDAGPWRHYSECYNVPSQDWLFRAWRQGKDLRLVPYLTHVIIESGGRPNIYADRASSENAAYFERITGDPGFRERELNSLALEYALQTMEAHWTKQPLRALKRCLNRSLFPLGVNAIMLRNMLRNPRKGGAVDRLRKERGLPPARKR